MSTATLSLLDIQQPPYQPPAPSPKSTPTAGTFTAYGTTHSERFQTSLAQVVIVILAPFILLLNRLFRVVSPRTLNAVCKTVDTWWHDVPAVFQQLLYDLGYRNPALESLQPSDRARCFPSAPTPPLGTQRICFRADRVVAFGWPSTGGMWVKELARSESAMLRLDSVDSAKPSLTPRDEDDFCHVLEQLGARWFPSNEQYYRSFVPDLGYDRVDLEAGV